MILLRRLSFNPSWVEPVQKVTVAHVEGEEDISFPVIRGLDASSSNVLLLQSPFVGVRFPHRARVHSGGAEVAFDCVWDDVSKPDPGVLNGQSLVEHQRGRFCRRVNCTRWSRDERSKGADEHYGRHFRSVIYQRDLRHGRLTRLITP